MPASFGAKEVGKLEQPCPYAKDKPATHWIEIELLDEADQPVVGEPYRIRLPDGSIHTGVLDKEGKARYDRIDAGMCEVWFPEIDERAVEGAPSPAALEEPEAANSAAPVAAAASPPRGASHWVEIVLLGDDDRPVDAEPYEVELPDGTLVTGILDEGGRAYLKCATPGLCTVSFPYIDETGWEVLSA